MHDKKAFWTPLQAPSRGCHGDMAYLWACEGGEPEALCAGDAGDTHAHAASAPDHAQRARRLRNALWERGHSPAPAALGTSTSWSTLQAVHGHREEQFLLLPHHTLQYVHSHWLSIPFILNPAAAYGC